MPPFYDDDDLTPLEMAELGLGAGQGRMDSVREAISLDEGLRRLRLLAQDRTPLQEIARRLGIPTHGATGKVSKGWMGLTVEAAVGQRPNSRKGMDFGDWELKTTSAIRDGDALTNWQIVCVGTLVAKDIMDYHYMESPIREKIERTVLAVISRGPNIRDDAFVTGAWQLAIPPEISAAIRRDYTAIRNAILEGNGQTDHLRAGLGTFLQVRPKSNAGTRRKGLYLLPRAYLPSIPSGISG